MFVGNERKIPMSRVNLLSKLHITLDEHRKEVNVATRAWRVAVVDFSADLSERVEKGDYTNLSFGVPQPKDNSKEILRAIQMVECTVEDTITLDEPTFNQWVMGEWSFRHQLHEIGLMASAMSGSLRKK